MPVVVTYELQRSSGGTGGTSDDNSDGDQPPFSGTFEVHDLDFITLRRLKDEFPFEGDLFFRARCSSDALMSRSSGAGAAFPAVWKDLVDDSELVPGGSAVFVKVLDLASLGGDDERNVGGRAGAQQSDESDDAFNSRAGSALGRPLAGRATPA